jgi:dynein light chain LC8-type
VFTSAPCCEQQSEAYLRPEIKRRDIMLESRAVIGDTDMLQAMQQHALRLAGKALDEFEAVVDATAIAGFIKKVVSSVFQSGLISAGCCISGVFSQEFDRSYGPGWQCVVGTDFGSFVTHQSGCFIYFGIGNLSILLFRGGLEKAVEA